MTLTTLEIRGFQSLRKLSLELGRMTVVTGHTGSGKSSVIRAAHLVAFNAKGTSYITQGDKTCGVVVGDREAGWAVGIERGGRGKDAYRISRLVNDPMQAEGFLDEPDVQVFTKLQGKVPDAVSGLHGLTPLNFAGQFDPPFLLTRSGADVARTLGELTNVTLIFRAAQEANRRRLGIMSDLKAHQGLVADLQQQVQRFAGLPARQAALQLAETSMAAAMLIGRKQAALHTLLVRLSATQAVLDAVVPPQAPSLTAMDALAERRARFQRLMKDLQGAAWGLRDADERARGAARTAEGAEQAVRTALEQAGVCPVCGQKVEAPA